MDKGRIMQLNEMKPNRTIKNPHWTNDKKNQIHCEFHYENGPIVNACVSDTKDGNPDWKEIFDTFDMTSVLLDIKSSLYLQPPTTTNSSKSIKTLTINPIGI